MRSVAILAVTLFLSIQAQAQRWNTPIKVVATSDREQVQQAIEAWRPFLPSGVTMELAEIGNVTIIREKGKKECSPTIVDGVIVSAVIRIDPKLKGEDFKLALEHELGHALGLQHRPNSIMAKPYVRTVKFAGLITIARIVQLPGASDAEQLRKLYALPENTAADAPSHFAPADPVVEREPPPAPILIHRYAFHRRITKGQYWRESDFIWDDKGKLIEINIKGKGHDLSVFKSVPQFPVGIDTPEGVYSNQVFAGWYQNSKISQYSVSWRTGAELLAKGGGDEKLLFPDSADKGDLHIEFTYKLHRSSVVVKEIDQ